MAKFSLPMKDGVAVRKMSELREHFDLKEAVKYLGNGRLMTWLRDRGYDEEAEKLDALVEEYKGNHTELAKGLCAALGMEFDATKIGAKEFEGLSELSQRADRLGQFTDNKALLATADRAAFDQADLDRLARDDNPDIYLVNGRFTIPLGANGKHYVGLGHAIAVIPSDVYVDLSEMRITFDSNVKFDDDYASFLQQEKNSQQRETYFQMGEKAAAAEEYEKALEYYKKADDMGYIKATTKIGVFYGKGLGVSEDSKTAREYLQRAAEEKEPEALLTLGKMFYTMEFCDPEDLEFDCDENDKMAFRYVRDAVDIFRNAPRNTNNSSYADALSWLAMFYRFGDGTEVDSYKAFDLYLQSAKMGDTDAMRSVGILYENGEGVVADEVKAKDWYIKAAEAGDICAMVCLGQWYENNENEYGNYDYEKAAQWYRKAMDAGNVEGKYRLGELYFEGNGVPKEKNHAFRLIKEAAEGGVEAAMNRAAVIYARGVDTPQDMRQALEWWTKAADAGNTAAMSNLGYCFESGEGVPQNYKEAAKWYKKAAELGDSDAMISIGRFFAEGIGGQKKDFQQARIWFKKAADAGDSNAMCWLGNMYYQGEGVTSDKRTAREWYRKSADQGNDVGMLLLGDWYCAESNYGSAREWYRKAMDMGNGRAAYELAKLFEEGKGSNKNAEQAKQLREKAKELGYDGSDGGGLLGTVASYAVGGAIGLGVAALSPWAGAAAGAVGLASWLFKSKKK